MHLKDRQELLDLSVPELARYQKELSDFIKSVEDDVKNLKDNLNMVRNDILPSQMESQGIDGIKIEGVGRVSIHEVLQVSVKAAAKEEFFDWLKDNGFEAIIKPTANSSSVKSMVAELREEGREVPTEMLNIHVFDQARITK